MFNIILFKIYGAHQVVDPIGPIKGNLLSNHEDVFKRLEQTTNCDGAIYHH